MSIPDVAVASAGGVERTVADCAFQNVGVFCVLHHAVPAFVLPIALAASPCQVVIRLVDCPGVFGSKPEIA